MTHKLIINADDYGHTRGVAEGIRRAHLQGIVTSTTAMMNRPAAVDELSKAQELCPRLGLGVHLVLTTGIPVLPAQRVPSLVDEVGRFRRRGELIKLLSVIDLDQVSAEWQAQVERFVEATGRTPDHIDSHHHCSYFTPGLFERMLILADEFRCPIRNPFADVSAPSAEYLPGGQPEAHLAAIQALLARFRPSMPQHFFSSFYDEAATPDHLQGILRQVAAMPADQACELMCHPAVVDDELRQISDYSDPRARELATLTDPELINQLKSLDIELTSF